MWPFKKKDQESKPAEEDPNAALAESIAADAPSNPAPSGGGQQAGMSPQIESALGKIGADIEKLKAQFSTFFEIQKSNTERFSMINQQVGELRSMMIERDKSGQLLEAKATQAIDLVKTVQPDKLMIEMRKSDGKIEALRANIESTENIINNMVSEIKDIKSKIAIFRGMEQVLTLNEESKKELMEIKKVQALVERHSDKVETIFTEMQKKFTDFAKFADTVKDLDKSFKNISSDFDSIKVKLTDLASKKEVENLITKFDDFEHYTSNVVKLINNKFEKMEKELNDDFRKKFSDTDKLLRGFEILATKTPDLDKYFNLLSDEAKKAAAAANAPAPVEKLKEPGEEVKVAVPPPPESVATKAANAVSGAVATVIAKINKK